MARGDRRMADLIEHAYRKGCRLDGWSDHFRFDLWEESIRDLDLDAHAYVHRPRGPEEVFPWDHIDMKVSRAYLWDEWQKALRGGMTEDCRDGECQNCGVCDFTLIQPRVFPDDGSVRRPEDRAAPPSEGFRQRQLTFAKTGGGRFWGHLEMVNIFIRALRRSGITLKFSEGFHPKPKIAFGDALPIGLESLCETMLLTVSDRIRSDELVDRLNRELPDGLRVTDCLPYRPNEENTDKAVIYRVTLHQGTFDAEAVERFKAADNVWIERTNRKGKLKKIDLKAMVQHIQCVTSDTLELVVHHRPDALLRPDIILQKVFALSSDAIRQARLIKLGYRLHKGENTSPNG
jgi:radical SAM-linked protein